MAEYRGRNISGLSLIDMGGRARCVDSGIQDFGGLGCHGVLEAMWRKSSSRATVFISLGHAHRCEEGTVIRCVRINYG